MKQSQLRTSQSFSPKSLSLIAAVMLGGFGTVSGAALSGAVLSGAVLPAGEALAQTRSSKIQFVKPKLARDRGAPGKRGEGASRTCLSQENPASLTALVPDYVEAGRKTQVLGKTTQSHPELAFYIPETIAGATASEMVLILMDESGNWLQDVEIEPPDRAGIIRVALPQTFEGLAVGDRIQWMLDMLPDCGGSDSSEATPLTASGWIERAAMSDTLPSDSEATAETVSEAAMYASQGFWFDALTLVAEQRQNDPTNEAAAADWVALLGSVGLDALTEADLLSSHTIAFRP